MLAGGLRVDYIGFALVVLGFGTLQIMLDRYQRDDGFSSSFITGLAIVAAACLISLVIWEFLHPQPVMNVRLLRSRAFAISCLMMFLVFFTLISTTQLLPQLAQELLGYNALEAGFTLAYGGMATLIVMPIAGFVTGRYVQPKWLIMGALIGTGWGLLSNSGLDLNMSFWNLATARITQVVWLPMLFIPLSAVSYVGVPPDRNNEASAMLNLMRNLGGSVGVSVVTTLLQAAHAVPSCAAGVAYHRLQRVWLGRAARAYRACRAATGVDDELPRYLLAAGHSGAVHLAAGAVPAAHAQGGGAVTLSGRPPARCGGGRGHTEGRSPPR